MIVTTLRLSRQKFSYNNFPDVFLRATAAALDILEGKIIL